MYQDVVRQLKKLKHGGVNPNADWVLKNRTQLLAQIKNTLPEQHVTPWNVKMWEAMSIFLPKTLVYNVVRPVAAFVVVALVATTAYSGTVKASADASPGEKLYLAKRAIEETQSAVVSVFGSDSTIIKHHINLAQRRAQDTKKIKSDDPNKVAKIAAVVADLKAELNTVNFKLNEQGSGNLKGDVAKDVIQNSEEIKIVLQDVKNDLSTNTTADGKDLTKEVSETKDLGKDVSVSAVQALVDNQNVSREDVKQAISTSIVNVISEVNESRLTVDGAKNFVDTVKTQVTDLNAELKKQATSVSSTNKEFTDQITTAASEAKETASKTQAVSDDIDKKVNEVKEFVDNNDLSKAIDKLKEVNEATKEAEKLSDTALEKTQQVLPLVLIIKDNGTSATGTVVVSTSTKGIFNLITATNTVGQVTVIPMVPLVTVNPTAASPTPKAASSTKTTTSATGTKK